MIGSHWDFDMLFNIVKVRLRLNYSLFGLKIKYIQGGIIDKKAEIWDILRRLLIFPRSQAYSGYWQRKTDNRFTETYNATGHSECNRTQ